ncbi:tetratricopeptide repeat protein [Paenibacillus sp. DCT19]|uniref:tetratricopeptide repeat protein n=1 Tax=Paenibacillus sp. DCT19 TaxID=2211212 RepID=UPI000FE25029|nr:diadenylate cyclase [Paenibacillus sp. DCT19]
MNTYPELKGINKIIYQHVESILKKINQRIHFRLFAIASAEGTSDKIYRVKKSISTATKLPKGINPRYEYINDSMQDITQVYKELGLRKEMSLSSDKLQDLIKSSQKYYLHNDTGLQNQVTTSSKKSDVSLKKNSYREFVEVNQMLYAGLFVVNNGQASSQYEIVYLLEIRNLEQNVQDIYYNKPGLSIIRMLLDYFFLDFFADSRLKLVSQSEISTEKILSKKYNEDELQFMRRVVRLFFGKMQTILKYGESYEIEHQNKLRSEYYINNLLDKIDDISTKTYEGANPFGSILFLEKSEIENQKQTGSVKFSIKFKADDLISLEDAKRIRKLLELTNIEKHLYLISDGDHVYGLGEVQWPRLMGKFHFRIDFKGISKYSLSYINFTEHLSNEGQLIVDEGQLVYRSNNDLRMKDDMLVSVIFKNPKLGEEGYTSERMISIIQEQFKDENSSLMDESVFNLEQVIRKAREQHHGTMVVITDRATADEELVKLKKQSTLIEPTIVDPNHIKFLTAIDGAIYFDTSGECHAIGVILDGIAQERQGDASRGARYNSAYRYYSKLEGFGKKCIIVIISEDGMIDVIPSLDDGEQVLTLIEEMVDFLDQEHEKSEFDDLFNEKEKELSKLKVSDFHCYFTLARKLESKEKYDKARVYFDKAFDIAGNSFIPAKYYNWQGLCYFSLGHFSEAAGIFETAISLDDVDDKPFYYANAARAYGKMAEGLNKTENKKMLFKSLGLYEQATNNSNLSNHVKANLSDWYNSKGLTYYLLIKETKDEVERMSMLQKEINSYSTAIEIDPDDDVLYLNRAESYKVLGDKIGEVKDHVRAYLLNPENADSIKEIDEILTGNTNILSEVSRLYSDLLADEKVQPNDELERMILKIEGHREVISTKLEVATGTEKS